MEDSNTQIESFDNKIVESKDINIESNTQTYDSKTTDKNIDSFDDLNYLNSLDDLFLNQFNSNQVENNSENERNQRINLENRYEGSLNQFTQESTHESNQEQKEEQNKENRKKRKRVCPGCEPNFQPNQLAHIGPYGCLGDY